MSRLVKPIAIEGRQGSWPLFGLACLIGALLGCDCSSSDSSSNSEGCASSGDQSSGCETSHSGGGYDDFGFGSVGGTGSGPGPWGTAGYSGNPPEYCPAPPHTIIFGNLGNCSFGGCDPGWADCDGDQLVCERNLRDNSDHCGICSHSCGGGGCSQGSCRAVDVVHEASISGPLAVGASSAADVAVIASEGDQNVLRVQDGEVQTLTGVDRYWSLGDIVLNADGTATALLAVDQRAWFAGSPAWQYGSELLLSLSPRHAVAHADRVWIVGRGSDAAGGAGGGGSAGVAGAGAGGAQGLGGVSGGPGVGGVGASAGAAGAAGSGPGGTGGSVGVSTGGSAGVETGGSGGTGAAGQGGGQSGSEVAWLLSIGFENQDQIVEAELPFVPNLLAVSTAQFVIASELELALSGRPVDAWTRLPGVAPRGIAFSGEQLLVVDAFDNVLLSIENAQVRERLDLPGAFDEAGVVVADGLGAYLVSGGTVYEVPMVDLSIGLDPVMGGLELPIDLALSPSFLFVSSGGRVYRVPR